MDVELLQIVIFRRGPVIPSNYLSANQSSSNLVHPSDTANITTKTKQKNFTLFWKIVWNMFKPVASLDFLSPVICKRYTETQHAGQRHVMSAWWHAECQMKTSRQWRWPGGLRPALAQHTHAPNTHPFPLSNLSGDACSISKWCHDIWVDFQNHSDHIEAFIWSLSFSILKYTSFSSHLPQKSGLLG